MNLEKSKEDYLFIVNTPYNFLITLSIILSESKREDINFHIIGHNSYNRLCNFIKKSLKSFFDIRNLRMNCFDKIISMEKDYWIERIKFSLGYLEQELKNPKKIFFEHSVYPEVLAIYRYREINKIDMELNLSEEGSYYYFMKPSDTIFKILNLIGDYSIAGDKRRFSDLFRDIGPDGLLTEMDSVFVLFPENIRADLREKKINRIDNQNFKFVVEKVAKSFEEELKENSEIMLNSNSVFLVSPAYYLNRINKIDEYKKLAAEYLDLISLKLRKAPIVKYHVSDSYNQFLIKTSYDIHYIPVEVILSFLPNIKNIFALDFSTSLYTSRLIRKNINVFLIKNSLHDRYKFPEDYDILRRLNPEIKVIENIGTLIRNLGTDFRTKKKN